jgi:hypothetical protein
VPRPGVTARRCDQPVSWQNRNSCVLLLKEDKNARFAAHVRAGQAAVVTGRKRVRISRVSQPGAPLPVGQWRLAPHEVAPAFASGCREADLHGPARVGSATWTLGIMVQDHVGDQGGWCTTGSLIHWLAPGVPLSCSCQSLNVHLARWSLCKAPTRLGADISTIHCCGNAGGVSGIRGEAGQPGVVQIPA